MLLSAYSTTSSKLNASGVGLIFVFTLVMTIFSLRFLESKENLCVAMTALHMMAIRTRRKKQDLTILNAAEKRFLYSLLLESQKVYIDLLKSHKSSL